MSRGPIVAGVGMTSFVSPSLGRPYTDLAGEAIRAALTDAGISYGQVQQVFAGYVYGDSTSGQRAVYSTGMTGIPIFNVNNNCATGSTALYLARQAVEAGAADCVLVVGFEQMRRGAIAEQYGDRPGPLEQFVELADRRYPGEEGPLALKLFGGAARDYAQRYGTPSEIFAAITVKSRLHAAENPLALFRDPVTLDEVLSSPRLLDPLTRLQCCPPTCGGAAAVIVSEKFARRNGLSGSIRIKAQSMTTDVPSSFDGDMVQAVGAGMTAAAAREVYESSGVDPRDIPVVELHDCFTCNEVISYEALGLVEEGGAEKMIRDRDNTYGGRCVTNPSGGLLSKGHPLGATGLAQCYELVQQLRGQSGSRQVSGARLALAHNIGLGGACVVTLYEQTDAR